LKKLEYIVLTLLLFATGIVFSGCFTTLQTARVKKGLHLTVATGILTDQKRNDWSQGSDVIGLIAPSYGLVAKSVGFEFGIPIGSYLEEGFSSDSYAREYLVLPYLKIGFNPQKRDKVALVGQAALIIPTSLTLIYSHDFNHWTPYLSVKTIFSGGPAGDDPVVTRYQEHDQSIWVAALGVEWPVKSNPAIEIGMFRNSYEEGFVDGYFGGTGENRVLYDIFLGGKVTF
jgi:hypothetical protein